MKKYLMLLSFATLAISFGFFGQVFAGQTNAITIDSVSALTSNPGYINNVGSTNITVQGTATSGAIVNVVLSDNATKTDSITGTQIIPPGSNKYHITLNSKLAIPEALHDGLINVSAYIISNSNPASATATATIIQETTAPVIVILGDTFYKCHIHDCTDLGAIAVDSFGNKPSITSVTNIRPDTEGDYMIKYYATDVAGNQSMATRRVLVTTSNSGLSTTTVVIPDIVQTLLAASSSAPVISTTIATVSSSQVIVLPTATSTQDISSSSVPMIVIKVSGVSSIIKRSLVIGLKGSDVRLLQILLAKDKAIYPEGIITGYFGNLTKSAVQRFQEKYNIVAKGMPGYGQVGPKTKAKLIELFGN